MSKELIHYYRNNKQPRAKSAGLFIENARSVLNENQQVEQMARQALSIADRAYVLETGRITLEGAGRELLNDRKVKEAYLGIH